MWALEACYLFGIWPQAGFGRNLWSHHPDATLSEEGDCLVHRRRTCGIPTVRKCCYKWRINERAAVMVVAEGLASMVITGMMKPSLSLGIMVWSCQAGTSQEKCILVLWHSSAADEALHPCMLFVVLCITVLAFRVGRSGGKFSFGQGFSVYGSMISRMVARRRVINWGQVCCKEACLTVYIGCHCSVKPLPPPLSFVPFLLFHSSMWTAGGSKF